MANDNSSMGERLISLRKVLKISQGDFALQLGISRSALQNYERNERDLPSSLLLKICELFDDDAHRLLTGRPSPLVIKKIDLIARLVDQRLEYLDVEMSSTMQWKIISKILSDEFRFMNSVKNHEIDEEEIENLVKLVS